MKVKLDNRLKAVFQQLDFDTKFADIGSDHGKLCAYALQNGKAKYAIASDISKKSIAKAENLIKSCNLENKMETRVGDGLNTLKKNEVDTVTICGMGGFEILKILKNTDLNFNKYIFVPHSNAKELRLYLVSKFNILADFLILGKGKYYDIIVCVNGKCKYDELEIEFGKDNFDTNLDFFEMLVEKEKQFRNYLDATKNENQIKDLKKQLSLIEEAIYRCQQQRN